MNLNLNLEITLNNENKITTNAPNSIKEKDWFFNVHDKQSFNIEKGHWCVVTSEEHHNGWIFTVRQIKTCDNLCSATADFAEAISKWDLAWAVLNGHGSLGANPTAYEGLNLIMC
jgi:hypothetical protein